MILYFVTAFFWFSLAVLLYTFLGYPLLMAVLARLLSKNVKSSLPSKCPEVTLVLAACNEEQRIIGRLQNLLAADGLADKLHLIVVSDGSTDATLEKIRAFNHPRVQLVAREQRGGKADCLNVGIARARTEIVVLADVRQRFAPDTIAKLLAHFRDPKIGAVSGALEIESAGSAIGGGVDAYWRLEKMLRRAESQVDSAVGCTGAVYAIRRALFQNLPPDTLLDDVVVPMQIATQGYRVIFDPEAVAYDPQSLEPEREKIRKQRTLAGNYQMLFRHPQWLWPWRNRIWWQLVSHKYLRLVAPFLLLSCLVSNAVLWAQPFYGGLLVLQIAFYLLALMGAAFPAIKRPWFSIPAGFVFLNLMALSGLWHYLRGSYRQGSWPTTKS